jgi:hypothetical protein
MTEWRFYPAAETAKNQNENRPTIREIYFAVQSQGDQRAVSWSGLGLFGTVISKRLVLWN